MPAQDLWHLSLTEEGRDVSRLRLGHLCLMRGMRGGLKGRCGRQLGRQAHPLHPDGATGPGLDKGVGEVVRLPSFVWGAAGPTNPESSFFADWSRSIKDGVG
ncbi:hypothetical protein WJX84_003284 [Apatococcus fuscideae]|uniref:Uncharacterized protein n=1 Tax=Apatococcus fuscideae TaxID=2026836 RepID=A0AAW1T9E3_9CHLO